MNDTRNRCTQFYYADSAPDTECCCSLKTFPKEISIAMAYVPFQQWSEVYTAEKGLCEGTLFPCLDLPFAGCMR